MNTSPFTNLTLYDDMVEFIPAIIETEVHEVNGGNHYEVVYQTPDRCNADNGPKIYFHNLDLTESAVESLCGWSTIVAFRVGIKFNTDNPGHEGYGTQLSALLAMFNAMTYNQYDFTITLGGVPFTSESYYFFGVRDVETITGVLQMEDSKCHTITHEFAVQWKIFYELEPIKN